MGTFASDALAAHFPDRHDFLDERIRPFLAAFAPMWAFGIAVAAMRPVARHPGTTIAARGRNEITANAIIAALAGIAYVFASTAPVAKTLSQAMSLVAIAGTLGSPVLATSIPTALVGRFRHLSLVARSGWIALILATILPTTPPLTEHLGYFLGPLGIGEWQWVGTMTSILTTAMVVMGAALVAATYPRADTTHAGTV